MSIDFTDAPPLDIVWQTIRANVLIVDPGGCEPDCLVLETHESKARLVEDLALSEAGGLAGVS